MPEILVVGPAALALTSLRGNQSCRGSPGVRLRPGSCTGTRPTLLGRRHGRGAGVVGTSGCAQDAAEGQLAAPVVVDFALWCDLCELAQADALGASASAAATPTARTPSSRAASSSASPSSSGGREIRPARTHPIGTTISAQCLRVAQPSSARARWRSALRAQPAFGVPLRSLSDPLPFERHLCERQPSALSGRRDLGLSLGRSDVVDVQHF